LFIDMLMLVPLDRMGDGDSEHDVDDDCRCRVGFRRDDFDAVGKANAMTAPCGWR